MAGRLTRQRGQPERIVKFAIGEQPSIGGQHPIPIHPSGSPSPPRAIQNKLLIAISESRKSRRNSVHYPVNAGLSDALAETVELFNLNGNLMWLNQGQGG